MAMVAKDLQLFGARILRDLVSEVREHLHLTEHWFDEALAKADPASEEELNAILYANLVKLQDLLCISCEELHTFVDNYDLLVLAIRSTVEADEAKDA